MFNTIIYDPLDNIKEQINTGININNIEQRDCIRKGTEKFKKEYRLGQSLPGDHAYIGAIESKYAPHMENSYLWYTCETVADHENVNTFYTEKVLAVVGDYKGTVQNDYPNIKFMRPNETSFDISELHVILNNTKFGGPNSISRPAQKKKVNYKELTDGPEKVLGDPTLYNPPRTYRLNNNKVYVDDKLILVKDNTWRFSND